MKDNKEKNNELFNQATELIKQLIMRNEHMYKDIAKKKKIIIYKNKTIKTKNETIKEKDVEIKKLKKKKKKKKNKNFMFVKLQKIIDYNDKIINKS